MVQGLSGECGRCGPGCRLRRWWSNPVLRQSRRPGDLLRCGRGEDRGPAPTCGVDPGTGCAGIVSDSCPLPLEDALATRVIALEMLEHVDDPAQVLAELVRVGQPGALYLLAVPDAAGEHLQKRFAPSYYFSAPNHVRIFEREQFAGLVRESGLEVLQQSTFGFYWTLWMCIYWTCARASGAELEGASHDVVQPPYPPLLNDWAKLWHQLLKMPESAPMKAALDDLLPKSQVIVARKPESRRS
nr:methyltransferase domain-containing protein [Pseudomonas aeruginosa]